MNFVLNQLLNEAYFQSFSKLMLEGKTLELLTLFLQQFVVGKTTFPNMDENLILESHQYIASNLDTNITISELIRKTGLNEHKLQKGFKALFGNTIQKHIKKLRIQKARQLIMQESLSVSEAAYRVGYVNLSHFATAFRREFGVLPHELKK
ncbi:AraC family transcriptional regulator [Cytophagales bacterium RKSG123]|nr:AraC family transcriptional regulator [Xanthovirga aplysinae]